MLAPKLIAPPAETPVSLEEARRHCRIDADDGDAVLTALINAATSFLDGLSGVLGRCLINQGWRLSLSEWPTCGIVRLPFPDVSAATVKYYDVNNAEQPVPATLFERLEDELGAFIKFSDDFTYPAVFDGRSDGVQVDFTAGYGGSADAVPSSIRAAILLLVAHWYNNREASIDGQQSEIPFGASALISPFRRVGV
ncbi:phage head-tail connector protein [Bradyrhizobium sp. BRP14]|nr:phage head-tail connector protein [Bradyrhizobium sp. BRP14]